MKNHPTLTRRGFIRATAAGSVALGWLSARVAPMAFASDSAKPALLGGLPVHNGGWTKWPQWREAWEPQLLKVFRSGKWFRGSDSHVEEFEKGYAQLLGAKRCLATASGTTALIVSLHVMDVDAGDEVIVSPYTFIASYNAILTNMALPVFADTDPATLTIDPGSIESRITERTRAIMPVHIFGMPCDMDPINDIAHKHKLTVVEDACQAWLAEYKGRRCGTLADLGCFSFQESKHIPSGEGGAITAMSDELLDKCHSYHNCCHACGTNKGNGSFTRGNNYRMTQAQAVILMQQFDKLVTQTATRRANADYLSIGLGKFPASHPYGCPKTAGQCGTFTPLGTMPRSLMACLAISSPKRCRLKGFPVAVSITNSITTACLMKRLPRAGLNDFGALNASRPIATAFTNSKATNKSATQPSP